MKTSKIVVAAVLFVAFVAGCSTPDATIHPPKAQNSAGINEDESGFFTPSENICDDMHDNLPNYYMRPTLQQAHFMMDNSHYTNCYSLGEFHRDIDLIIVMDVWVHDADDPALDQLIQENHAEPFPQIVPELGEYQTAQVDEWKTGEYTCFNYYRDYLEDPSEAIEECHYYLIFENVFISYMERYVVTAWDDMDIDVARSTLDEFMEGYGIISHDVTVERMGQVLHGLEWHVS